MHILLQVGVGAFILNSRREILLVQEANGILKGKVCISSAPCLLFVMVGIRLPLRCNGNLVSMSWRLDLHYMYLGNQNLSGITKFFAGHLEVRDWSARPRRRRQ